MKKQSLRFQWFNALSYAREHRIKDAEVRRAMKSVAKDFNPRKERMMYELHVLRYVQSLVREKFGWDYFVEELTKTAEEVRKKHYSKTKN